MTRPRLQCWPRLGADADLVSARTSLYKVAFVTEAMIFWRASVTCC